MPGRQPEQTHPDRHRRRRLQRAHRYWPGNAGPHGTKDIAEAYLRFLYTPAAQAIIAKHHFRPASPEYASEADRAQFPKLELVTIDGQFGGWARAQSQHFADGGTFDQLYGKK